MTDLLAPLCPAVESPLPGLTILRGFADADGLFGLIERIAAQAPFRHLLTPGGKTMSAAMTNCGPLGWVSDRRGYRYEPLDPLSGRPWPEMPETFRVLARRAMTAAGFDATEPDACLVNRYAIGARMTAHQDRDEADFATPIVSVSIGLPAVFLWHGERRGGSALRIPLAHGDVVVFGGPARKGYHGVKEITPGEHPLTGPFRYNLTFRRAR